MKPNLKLCLAAVFTFLTLTASAAIRFVNVSNSTPATPYLSWATAATTIQDAVDTSSDGDEIVVTNGVYDTGSRLAFDSTLTRVIIDKAVKVRSVNGPAATFIVGQSPPSPPPGEDLVGQPQSLYLESIDDPIRCVYLGTNAFLCGFTLTNGCVPLEVINGSATKGYGAGVYCESSAFVTNCVLTGNSAGDVGGGAAYGTLDDCILTGNMGMDCGGAWQATLYNCIISNNVGRGGSGGAAFGYLSNCIVVANSGHFGGGFGGGSLGRMDDCLIISNRAEVGGGVWGGYLNRCILIGNIGDWGGGGGTHSSFLTNCILTGNWAPAVGGGAHGGGLYSCILSNNSSATSGGASHGSSLSSCILVNNTASSGGGAASCMLTNCTLVGNFATNLGGGAWSGTLVNCSVTENSAAGGGGTHSSTLFNSIVYYNTAATNSNFYGGSFAYSCTDPLPPGEGNIDLNPLMASGSHLSAESPCIGRGSPDYTTGVDIDGEAWLNPPCMGADQYLGTVTGELLIAITASYTNLCPGLESSFVSQIRGGLTASIWDFGDGILVTNQPYVSHVWTTPGIYTVRLTGYNDSYPSGLSATLLIRVAAPDVYYVNAANATPVFPFTNRAEAARTIQDAIDAGTQLGRRVLVADGVYDAGGRAVYGSMTNRVVIPELGEVRSENGPNTTFIVGQGVGEGGTNNGDGAIRCVYIGSNAVLNGFTLTNGHTRNSGDASMEQSGGGAWCEQSGFITNCIFTGNSAVANGGGAYKGTINNCTFAANWSASFGGGVSYGTLNQCNLYNNACEQGGGGVYSSTLQFCNLNKNHCASEGGGTYLSSLKVCTLTDNSASMGGAASGGTMSNCTMTGNSASQGGGVYSGTLFNCIVYFNTAYEDPNYLDSTLAYSCAMPLPQGPGNIDAAPQLASKTHLSANSPCIGQGSPAYASGVDIDGEPWQTPPSMGADQYVADSATGEISAAIWSFCTNVCPGVIVSFNAQIDGRLTASIWDFGEGILVTNQPYVSHVWTTPGIYTVRLTGYNDSYPNGVSATLLIRVAAPDVYYVNATNAAPVFPFTNRAEAARTIQEAIDAGTQLGRLVLVADGVYDAGGRAANRVVIPESVEVRSENGPKTTFIVGQDIGAGGTNNGDGAIRCVYVGSKAVLNGFTLTNGHTGYAGGGAWCEEGGALFNCLLIGNEAYEYGGGAYIGKCFSVTLSNCVLSGNAARFGGGVYNGVLNNCDLNGNSALYGGGAHDAILNRCTLSGNFSLVMGGGVYKATLNNCTMISNTVSYLYGGGASSATLNGCILMGNAAGSGGGAYSCTLNNCTLVGNKGGGTYESSLTNCIVYYNTNNYGAVVNYSSCSVGYCCTTPLPPGSGNIDSAPLFVNTNGWSDLRLQSNSPCINTGNNASASDSTDLDGNPRIAGVTVDMGAYEFQGAPFSGFTAWAWQYGLPIHATAGSIDSDGDGLNNGQEWRCGTNPTNAASALRLLAQPNASNVELQWQAVSGVNYFLQRSTNLLASPPFQTVATNLTGTAGIMSYTDMNPPEKAPLFYRLGVGE